LDPVRIAMQWVAADPEARASLNASSRSVNPAAPVSPPPGSRREEPLAVEEVEVQALSLPAAERVRPHPAAEKPASRAIAAPVRPSSLEVSPMAPDRHERHPDAPVEEVVEISIGAINLHVEGPRQTVVQSPPAPGPRSAPAARRARSGLARRYLRSF
jgi:hypothetical protein